MRTIGRKWPKRRLDGDFTAMCDYCGVHWRFFQMRRDRAGYLVCPDEGPGLDALSLSEANARGAHRRRPRNPNAYGNYDEGVPSGDAVHRTSSEDIET